MNNQYHETTIKKDDKRVTVRVYRQGVIPPYLAKGRSDITRQTAKQVRVHQRKEKETDRDGKR